MDIVNPHRCRKEMRDMVFTVSILLGLMFIIILRNEEIGLIVFPITLVVTYQLLGLQTAMLAVTTAVVIPVVIEIVKHIFFKKKKKV